MPQGFETAEITPRSTTTGLSAGTESIVFLVTWDQSPLERFSTECRKTNTTVTVIILLQPITACANSRNEPIQICGTCTCNN